MLRLIIVDDEKVIRETIHNIIDWGSMNIEVIGVCKNGIEAYNMIIDEYPDIVMTDIKMPGLSGLELISRLSETDISVEFIILSGYGEFEYAIEAMKYGVKHYLLKPCNESQIIEIISQVSEDCYKKLAYQDLKKEQQNLTNNLRKNIIRNIIVEGLSQDADFPLLVRQYGKYFDFEHSNYELYLFYFLEEKNLNDCLTLLYNYNNTHFPSIPLHAIYVKNTLLIFFQSYSRDYSHFEDMIGQISFTSESVKMQIEHSSFSTLRQLLEQIIHKLKRYEMIYVMNGLHIIPTCNYNVLFENVEELSRQLMNDTNNKLHINVLNELKELFSSVEDSDFLKSLITNFWLKLPNNSNYIVSPVSVTEMLLEMNELSQPKSIREMFFGKLDELFQNPQTKQGKYKDFIDSILAFVEDNLDNPNLSLKWIVENHLYMNVDYVSKQFVKQTGDKFSTYLTNARITKAKELLLLRGFDKIYTIAEEIGCGNNPQYFSQIFKKNTGMTPTEFVKKMNGDT